MRELTVDDEDGERSYNFRMVIQVGNDPSIQPVPTLNAYLRSKFDNENIRVVPLYFAKPRPVVKRDGTLIMADDARVGLLPGLARDVA